MHKNSAVVVCSILVGILLLYGPVLLLTEVLSGLYEPMLVFFEDGTGLESIESLIETPLRWDIYYSLSLVAFLLMAIITTVILLRDGGGGSDE